VGEMAKFAFIMRGVPGSGKSTTARYLAGDWGIIHAVDSYHCDENGNFLWDDELEDEKYRKNFEAFSESCKMNHPVVICDCINIKREDFQKYIDIAREHGYVTSEVVLDKPNSSDAANRNKHSVSKEQIEDMFRRWED
jgi:predicted kinase